MSKKAFTSIRRTSESSSRIYERKERKSFSKCQMVKNLENCSYFQKSVTMELWEILSTSLNVSSSFDISPSSPTCLWPPSIPYPYDLFCLSDDRSLMRCPFLA